MKRKVVAYYRVSTARQGASGLGLEAQRVALESYCHQNGCEIVREFTEVESGKNDKRPKLGEALASARRSKSTLLLAKLDRLSRSVRFIATVLDSGVEFAAADVPSANRLLLHVLAAVAENELTAIRTRTKAALGAAKARGVLLGTHNPAVRVLSAEARQKGATLGAEATRKAAVDAYADLMPVVSELRNAGESLQAIAQRLNDDGHETRTGAQWTPTQVHRLLKRAA